MSGMKLNNVVQNNFILARNETDKINRGVNISPNSLISFGTQEGDKVSFNINYSEAELKDAYEKIVTGIKNYFKENGFKKAVLGLSGGIDSAVCVVLLVDALGADNVIGVSMPSKITSSKSKNDAEILAQNLGIKLYEAPISKVVNAVDVTLEPVFKQIESVWDSRPGVKSNKEESNKKPFTTIIDSIKKLLATLFSKNNSAETKQTETTTFENLQARSRATYLFAIANEFPDALPICTCDKSEDYIGYATVNGDMSGGLAPIADLTKTKTVALGYWLNKNREVKNAIPESSLKRPPGPELKVDPLTGQTITAEKANMPYEFLDEIIFRIEKQHQNKSQMMEDKFEYEKTHTAVTPSQRKQWIEKFFKKMSQAFYKWKISPPGIQVDTEPNDKTPYNANALYRDKQAKSIVELFNKINQ